MICPLLAIATPGDMKQAHRSLIICAKEECAWWLEDISMCAIRDLALELRYIHLRLATIVDKMPHEGQFRK